VIGSRIGEKNEQLDYPFMYLIGWSICR